MAVGRLGRGGRHADYDSDYDSAALPGPRWPGRPSPERLNAPMRLCKSIQRVKRLECSWQRKHRCHMIRYDTNLRIRAGAAARHNTVTCTSKVVNDGVPMYRAHERPGFTAAGRRQGSLPCQGSADSESSESRPPGAWAQWVSRGIASRLSFLPSPLNPARLEVCLSRSRSWPDPSWHTTVSTRAESGPGPLVGCNGLGSCLPTLACCSCPATWTSR